MEEFWYQLETMVPWVRGVDRMPLMIGALGLVVAVFWLMSRKGGGGGGGRRSLDAAYRKIENADIDQWQRPYALIATRPPWDDLPQYFLMELTARLIDKENLFEFILLTEKHKLARQRIPKIAQSDAGTAMGMLSEELANLAGRLRGREAETAYSLAVAVDPANARAAYGLAARCYAGKRYAEAIPLLEQAIPLCEAVLETAERLDVQTKKPGGAGEPEDMQSLFDKAEKMYHDCVQRV